MGASRGEKSLGAVIFVAIAAGLLICCVWKIMWGRLHDDDDDHQDQRGGGDGDRARDDSGHISLAGSDDDDGSSGHISFLPTDDEESDSGHVAVSPSNSDHICMSRSSSSSSGYCVSDSHASGAAMDYELTPRDYRAPV